MLNGCSAKEIDKERLNKSFFMDYSEPKVLAQSAIMMADCQKNLVEGPPVQVNLLAGIN